MGGKGVCAITQYNQELARRTEKIVSALPALIEALRHAREDLVSLGAEDSGVSGVLIEIDNALRAAGVFDSLQLGSDHPDNREVAGNPHLP